MTEMPGPEFLQLIGQLFPKGRAKPSGGGMAIGADAAAPPPRRAHAKVRGRAQANSAPALPPPPSRAERLQIIQAAGADVVRRTVLAMSRPAAIPETRRAVSTVAARYGIHLHPIIPEPNSLADEYCNRSPSRLALEMFMAAPADTMPSNETFFGHIRSATACIDAMRDLVGLRT